MVTRLDALDLTKTLSHDESEKRIQKAQRRLTQLRLFTAGLIDASVVGPGLVIVFEGFDAAGKGGAASGTAGDSDYEYFGTAGEADCSWAA